MSNIRKLIILILLIMLSPVRCNASSESELLMDSFMKYCCRNREYKELNCYRNRYKSIGTYEITAYCSCNYCCGKSNGLTASGTKATANHTIAADLNRFSFGDEVIIDGKKYVIEDTGGAIKNNRIDMFFESHSSALSYGRRWEKLYTSYECQYVLKEVPLYEWVDIKTELENDESILVIESDYITKWYNQAGNLVAYKYSDGGYENYIDERIYKKWMQKL